MRFFLGRKDPDRGAEVDPPFIAAPFDTSGAFPEDRTFRDRTFRGMRADGGIVEGMAAFKCTFEGCWIGMRDRSDRRTIIRNVALIDCHARGFMSGPAIFENVLVDGLTTSNLPIFEAPAFRHVVLRGKLGRIMVSHVHSTVAPKSERPAFQEANRRFYAEVDWALDITEAEFTEADLRGIPGHLVRRDPATQVLVRRERLLDRRWQNLFTDSWIAVACELMLEDGRESEVLVAAKRSRNFERDVKWLRQLREAGIADAD
ncbi:MAG TPA: hypothetical protein VFI15_05995 [Candidatus Limnocylindrales bacterium]|nr:hypothetical protein [Candidatus Limnocylindrales bacterium]